MPFLLLLIWGVVTYAAANHELRSRHAGYQNSHDTPSRVYVMYTFNLQLNFQSPSPANPYESLVKFGKCQLKNQPEGQLCMLKHMIEAEKLNLVFRCMDVIVRVLELGFNHKSRRIAGLGCRGMIRAGVSTLCQDIRNITILRQG